MLIFENNMKNKAAPRSLWKKAIVVEVHPGQDDLVHSTTLTRLLIHALLSNFLWLQLGQNWKMIFSNFRILRLAESVLDDGFTYSCGPNENLHSFFSICSCSNKVFSTYFSRGN